VPTDSVSDIAFLLIIFFILTTSIRKLTGFETDIPAAEQTQQQQQPDKTPTVKLHAEGMTFNDQPVTLEGLRAELRRLNLPARPEDRRVVVLEAAQGVSYQHYYQAMAAVSSSGGVVGILAEEEGAKK